MICVSYVAQYCSEEHVKLNLFTVSRFTVYCSVLRYVHYVCYNTWSAPSDHEAQDERAVFAQSTGRPCGPSLYNNIQVFFYRECSTFRKFKVQFSSIHLKYAMPFSTNEPHIDYVSKSSYTKYDEIER